MVVVGHTLSITKKENSTNGRHGSWLQTQFTEECASKRILKIDMDENKASPFTTHSVYFHC